MKIMAIILTATLATLALSGCSRKPADSDTAGAAVTDSAQAFDSPEAAVEALVAAAEKDDAGALKIILGPGTDDLLYSGDEVEDRAERDAFVARYREKHEFVAGTPDNLVLQVGADNWPLPIPLLRDKNRWYFDAEAGAHELVVRRIGANELRTIDVMRGYVEAQNEYAAEAHDGNSAGVYAQRLRSEPGKQNGLYWEVEDGEPESPAGPLLGEATAEGYTAGRSQPYHGYLFRILLSQGDAANGGAQDYLIDGKLENGFALIATPAEYGASGIMTFMVNQDGIVWQRDLGEDTMTAAAAITQFNPDNTWTPIAFEDEEDSDEAVALN